MLLHYEKLIYNIAYRMFSNQEDSNDMLQEVFLKAYKNISHCKDLKHFKSWLCTIATNTCIDELRKRKGKQTESLDKSHQLDGDSLDNQLELSAAKAQLTPEDETINKELRQDLQRALNKIPTQDRLLIILRDIQGFSYNEMADIAGLNMGTVKSRLSRARQKMKSTFLAEQKRKLFVIK